MIVTFNGDSVQRLYEGWQYDVGQALEVHGLTGLPAAVQIHFAVDGADSAEPRMGSCVDDVLTCDIPDTILRSTVWWAYIFVQDGDAGNTVKAVKVTSKSRPEADDTVSSDDQSVVDDLITELNTLIATVGQTNNAAAASAAAAALSEENAAGYAGQAAEGAAAVAAAVSTHNLDPEAHDDIRQGITEAISTHDSAEDAHSTLFGAKADKVTGAIAGNLAALDENGNLTDSTKKPADFLTPSDIINDATTGGIDKAWSAEQGKSVKAQLIEKTSYGVISGLGVTAQASPNMTVAVAAGIIYMANGDRFTPSANNALAVTAADVTNSRVDIVYINSSGMVSYLAGTAAASPSAPGVPAGGQKIAELSVAANVTTIVAANIADRRKDIYSEAWIYPTLINSWAAYNSGLAPKYKKFANGIVFVQGLIKSGTSGTVAFTLPAGYRPAVTAYIRTSIGSSNGATITVSSNGDVYASGPSTSEISVAFSFVTG